MSTQSKDRESFPPDPSPPNRKLPFVPNPRRSGATPYQVVLVNNAHRDMMFIVRTIMELTRFGRTEALHKMWQAHYNGKAVLIITHRERAELFVELFSARGVNVAMEPI